MCLAGVFISGMVLGEHYNTKPSPCSINDRWDCGIVNHSPYAVVHFNASPYAALREVPVALIGILGYAVLIAVAGRYPRITLLLALIALIFTLRLTWIEWRVLGVWCIYCVSSQIVIAVIFLLSLIAALVRRKHA
ncbi:MAG TPA: vitamin K epoxide reductase family protein [Terriglobales bacterium]|nr:vitamin K epoxide reductase family protein [Terriglobales bacterium]